MKTPYHHSVAIHIKVPADNDKERITKQESVITTGRLLAVIIVASAKIHMKTVEWTTPKTKLSSNDKKKKKTILFQGRCVVDPPTNQHRKPFFRSGVLRTDVSLTWSFIGVFLPFSQFCRDKEIYLYSGAAGSFVIFILDAKRRISRENRGKFADPFHSF